MMWLLYPLAAGIVLFVAGGWDDARRRRAEARAELARARARTGDSPEPPPGVYRDAHDRQHAAARPFLPHIPHQRTRGDR